MKELPKYKSWFFLNDVAKILSKHLNEDWETRDVLQVALEGQLALSWYVATIQLALPSGIKLNEPDFFIDDMTDLIRLKGIYRLVLDDSEPNMCAGDNIRKEWLERFLFGKPATDGMAAMTGFLVKDEEDRLFRPLEYIEAGSSGLFGAECDVKVTPMPKGYYPQILMPDISELIIRKTDLALFLRSIPLSLENNETQSLVEFKNMGAISYNDITIVFVEENRVELIANKEKKIFTLGELGLINKNTGKINTHSMILIGYATGRKISTSKGKVKQRVNDLIKTWFNNKISGEPFVAEKYKYICNMTIKDDRSRSSERAKLKASNKHDSFNEETSYSFDQNEKDEAADFIAKNNSCDK